MILALLSIGRPERGASSRLRKPSVVYLSHQGETVG